MPTPLEEGATRAGVPRHRAHFYERRDADLHCPGVPPPPIPMSMEAPASSASPPPHSHGATGVRKYSKL